MNAREEFELNLAANQAEPEKQAGLVPGPDPQQIKIKNFFLKNQIQLNARSPRERKACCVNICLRKGKKDSNCETPCTTALYY